ncbi:hypothetical protein [Leisingera sp.]|uniref:hypothetical protein n=1 Tax=Leisingera sp. TaxID=1879318 RepID=UPI003A91F78D
MSDPVTHAEIEDVLSSIRRLVSEDTRSDEAAPHPAARLVLTPALRVQDGPATSEDHQDQDGAAPAAAPVASAAQSAADTASATLAEIPDPDPDLSAPAQEDFAAEPPLAFHHRRLYPDQTATDQAAASEDVAAALRSEADAASVAQADAAETGEGQAPWGRPGATLFAAAADAAVHEEAPAGEGIAAEPCADDRSEVSEFNGTHAAAEQPATANPAPEAATAEAPETAARSEGAAQTESVAHRAASVVRKIAEMEARSQGQAAGAPEPVWEPDSKTEGPFASIGPDVIVWRDEPVREKPLSSVAAQSAELAAAVQPAKAAEQPAQPAAWAEAREEAPATQSAESDEVEALTASAATEAAMDALAAEAEANGEAYLDEDGLRELVASIVREELQGALGERITRNVRKLVRREIHRALAAHDLL